MPTSNPDLGASVFAPLMLIICSALLWVYPTISAVQLLGAEPVGIVVLGCGTDPGNTHSKRGCTGEWPTADGRTTVGSVSASAGDHRPGQVVQGFRIGDGARLSTTGWLIDMAVAYPLAIVASFFAVRAARRWNRRRDERLHRQPIGLGGI